MADKKILFFDDEPHLSQRLIRHLTLLGWDITLVDEVDDLFRELKSHHFNILIIDMMAPVPNMDNEHIHFTKNEIIDMTDTGINTGVVVAKKIWEIEDKKFKDIPILFLSARQRPDSINQFQIEGKKCECLRKPELAKSVDSKLKQLLNYNPDNEDN